MANPKKTRSVNKRTARDELVQEAHEIIETDAFDESLNIASLGESLRRVRTESKELSHDFCEELIDMPEFVGERPLRGTHVKKLENAMDRKTFLWELVNIVLCKCQEPHNGYPAGTVFRMNGRHTAWARLGRPVSERAPIKLLYYIAKTEHDMRRLYASIDRNGPRTKENVVTSYIAGREQFAPIKSWVMKKLSSGLSFWKWPQGHVRKQHDGDDVAYIMLTEHSDLVLNVGEYLSKYVSRDINHIMRSPVIAALFATFNADYSDSITFWDGVCTGLDFSSAKDPRRQLYRVLLENSVAFGGGATFKTTKKIMSQETMMNLCIVAWNAWREGRGLSVLKSPKDNKRPEVN